MFFTNPLNVFILREAGGGDGKTKGMGDVSAQKQKIRDDAHSLQAVECIHSSL